MIQVRLSHSAHADMCACGPLSYPAGPACWQSGCLSSRSGTSPSKQTWSEVGRDHEARPEISEKTTRRDEDRKSTCGLFFWLLLKLLLTWLNVKNYMQGIFFVSFWDINSLFLLLTWKASLFLRCRLLSLRSVFCFSSSSSFSRARICSSKHIRASSLSISVR